MMPFFPTMPFYVSLTLLAALWGGSFLFLRIASPEFGPVTLVFFRTGIAAVVLLPWAWMAGDVKHLLQRWRLLVFLAASSTALPFTLFAYTSMHLSSGYMSILNATTPFFSALVAHFWLRETLTRTALGGLFLGFVGVAWLSQSARAGTAVLSLLPVFAALAATLLYAFGSTVAKRYCADLSPLSVAAGSQCYSALLLLVPALWWWPEVTPGPSAWLAVGALAVFCTAIALLIFFRLLQTQGVTKTVSVTYLIPVFAILWGALLLGETVSSNMLLGGLCVLVGVGLTTGLLTLPFYAKR